MFRLGIIDLDSSHAVEFTRRFHHVGVDRDQFVEGAKVVLAVGRESVMSPERVPGFSRTMEQLGVPVVDSPEQLLGQVDAVLVLSVCGQSHQSGALPFLEAGLPVFVDKPFACTLEDARQMAELADKSGSLLWSSSAMRFSDEVQSMNNGDSQLGEIQSVLAFGPAIHATGNPGLLHYGIHSAEVLFTLLGSEYELTSRVHREDADLITAVFSGTKFGMLRGARTGSNAYGFTAFCERGVIHRRVSTRYAYRNLCRAIVQSLETGQPPVPLETTLNLLEFLTVANAEDSA